MKGKHGRQAAVEGSIRGLVRGPGIKGEKEGKCERILMGDTRKRGDFREGKKGSTRLNEGRKGKKL